MARIRLTQWDSGLPVSIEKDQIAMIQRLPAYSCQYTRTEGGERTRVDTRSGQILLVTETVDEIEAMCNAITEAPNEQ